MDTTDWDQLVTERDAWVAHNFPKQGDRKHDTIFGVVEEWGELTHGHLKMMQGIRGNDETHLAEMYDAVGDLSIYLLGVMSYAGVRPDTEHRVFPKDVDQAIMMLGRPVANLTDYGFAKSSAAPAVSTIVWVLEQLCKLMGWDYYQIVFQTWESVKERDWIKFPKDGRTA